MSNNILKIYLFLVLILLTGLSIFSNNYDLTGYAVGGERLIVSLDIPSDQQKINPGESLLLEVVIREAGGNIDQASVIDLEYSIQNYKEEIISSKRETGVIAVKQSEVTSLLIPTNTKPGVYTANVAVNYQGNVYSGSKTFEIVSVYQINDLNIIVFIILAILVVIILLILIRRKKQRKLPEPPKPLRRKRRK